MRGVAGGPPEAAGGWYEVALTVLRALALLAILPAVFLAMMSPMIFDASGSEKNDLAQYLFFGLLAGPVVAFLTARAAKKALRQFTIRRFALSALYPLAWATYMVVVVTTLNRVCGGEFVCP